MTATTGANPYQGRKSPLQKLNRMISMVVIANFMFMILLLVTGKGHHPFDPFIVCLVRPDHPEAIILAGGPLVYKGIIIRAAGIAALAARIDAIRFGLGGEMNDHPPAGTMKLFGGIDAMRASPD